MGDTPYFETTLTRDRIEAMTSAGHWPDDLLIDRFAEKLSGREDQALIVDRYGTVTWGRFAAEADRLARGLLAIGLRPGQVVQLQLPNRREFPLAVLACERIGLVVNPVAPIFRHNEVSVMTELAKPAAVITVGAFRGFGLAAMHTELREAASWPQHLIVVDSNPEGTDPDGSDPEATGAVGGAPDTDRPADTLGWNDVLAAGDASGITDEAIALLRPSPNDVCEIMFTSGTTGQPKGVLHCQNTINSAADLWLERVAPDCSVFHMASTLAHQTGYLYGIRAPITAGGTVHYQEVWDPTEFAGMIDEHRIQSSMGATPFLADLLGVDGLDQRDLSSFTVFVCAGATIPLPVLEEARDRLPCTVMPGWGMTETALSTTGHRDDPFEKRATDGAAMRGSEVRVVDGHGTPVADGIEGDLQFRGALTFIGYLQGRALTEAGFAEDGWFDTGDRAIRDADGYITISGRTKDIIIRGGENVPVKDIEDMVLRHPAIAGVALIAKPHDRLGEVGCAVVTLADGTDDPPTLAGLTEFLDTQGVTKQFWPEDLVIVDGFPMTPSGKVQKFQLRQRVLGL